MNGLKSGYQIYIKSFSPHIDVGFVDIDVNVLIDEAAKYFTETGINITDLCEYDIHLNRCIVFYNKDHYETKNLLHTSFPIGYSSFVDMVRESKYYSPTLIDKNAGSIEEIRLISQIAHLSGQLKEAYKMMYGIYAERYRLQKELFRLRKNKQKKREE